ncbi:MAG: histidine--tRNA ligase [Gammaproteobacteria bacterium]|nr:histidine--tRNA ligase [Gammaproteobacteria bacterium]
MAGMIKAVKGMHDVLPDQSAHWLAFERTFIDLATAYGYKQIRMPLVEQAEVFKRTVGEATDIVEKEMYSFTDRNGDFLCLRPEGTASCVRASIENGLLRQGAQRLWYGGPMFRRERPQAGRYRQFHQFGLETLGMSGPDIDAELIIFTHRLWRALGIEGLELQINSLGTVDSRAGYRERLVAYFESHFDRLDEDSKRRLTTNPLRILDSKNPDMQALIEAAPMLSEYLDDESRQDFEQLMSMLDQAGVAYRVNPRLVRGLDYYQKLVFEWVGGLGAQSTVCAGGRYDGLVAQLGGPSTPAAGFALGVERLLALMAQGENDEARPHACLIVTDPAMMGEGFCFTERLRDVVPGIRVVVNCGGGNLKNQFKKADRSGAAVALVLGQEERQAGEISVKFLREERDQTRVAQDALPGFLSENGII